MKILVAHNFYQSSAPSGEDGVYQAEKELLKNHGNEVVAYERRNDDILSYPFYKKLGLPQNLLWSRKSYKELLAVLDREKPDLVHFHNIFYLMSPSAYYACKEIGIPVVQTLHNFRFFCTNGLLLRGERVCEDCLGRLPWRGLWHRCFRDSLIFSGPLATALTYHQLAGTLSQCVDAFIALTEFAREKYISAGLPPEKLFVKPNFLANPPFPSNEDQGYGVFLGRLSKEKGLDTLLDSVKLLGYRNENWGVRIIGEGPAGQVLRQRATDERLKNIEFMGRKNFHDSMRILASSAFMVIPSIWYEGFPMVIREAYACGKPVIASRLGSMSELVVDGVTGLLFNPGDAVDLASKIAWLLENRAARSEMGRNARTIFEQKYTSEKNYEILQNIYRHILRQ